MEKNKKYHIVSWYDWHSHNYITQLKDENDNQIGDAAYDGSSKARNYSIKMLKKYYQNEILSKIGADN
jgi:hypothetical protein